MKWTDGNSFGILIENKQHCPKHGCKLAKLKVWKDSTRISGFEAVFEYPDTQNWEPVTLLFGSKTLVTSYQEKAIDFEVLNVGLSFDSESSDSALAAILLSNDTKSVEVKTDNFSSGYTGWYELGNRLVGFETKEGMTEDGNVYNIRSIRPLQDRTSCQTATDLISDRDTNKITMSMIVSDAPSTTTFDISENYTLETPFGEQCPSFTITSLTSTFS